MENPIFLFLSVGAVSLFSFIAVAVWSEARKGERKAYYRYEMLKKLAEAESTGATAVLQLLHDQEKNAQSRVIEGIKLSGLVTCAVGFGLLFFLKQVLAGTPTYLCGLLPLFIGVALLAYGYVLAPKR